MLTLLVLFVADPTESLRFFTACGLRFAAEQHGAGPMHYAAALPGGLTLELYPAGSRPPTRTRLGLTVADAAATLRDLVTAGFAVDCAVALDPDGNAVELAGCRCRLQHRLTAGEAEHMIGPAGNLA